MGTTLDDSSFFQHHDAVSIPHGRQPVSNHKGGATLHQGVHATLHQGFGACINGRCSLVQNQTGRICHSGTGNGQQLTLTLAQVSAVTGQHRLVAIRQTADKPICIGQLGSGNALVIRSIQPTVADVIHHRTSKQVSILQHHAKAAAQVSFPHLVHVNVIVANLTILNIIEPIDQVGNGGLAGTCAANKGDLLAGLGKQVNIVENHLFRGIPEGYIIKDHTAGQLGVGHRAFCLMGMLPCPHAGAVVCFA